MAGEGPGVGSIQQAKLVLLGDMGAGKSSLVLRFVKGQFFDYQARSWSKALRRTCLHREGRAEEWSVQAWAGTAFLAKLERCLIFRVPPTPAGPHPPLRHLPGAHELAGGCVHGSVPTQHLSVAALLRRH